MFEGCDRKFVTGRNWARHMTENHQGKVPLVTACAGDACNSCIKGKYSSSFGTGPLYGGRFLFTFHCLNHFIDKAASVSYGRNNFTCESCWENKRTDKFPKDSKLVCTICLSVKKCKTIVNYSSNSTVNGAS